MPGRFGVPATLAALALLTACKPPRSPREVAGGSITGRWMAESSAVGAPHDTGRITWRLSLEERAGGRLSGRGSRAAARDSTGFALSGIRSESGVTLHFDLEGERSKYHGGIMNPRTIAGEMYLPHDTLTVTFTRE